MARNGPERPARRAGGLVVLSGIAVLLLAGTAQARTPRRGFNLFAPAASVLLRANRVHCNINNIGELCVDPNGSPVLGGGFWPAGTPDEYIFNGGLQVAGFVAGADQANFPWPGDTVGAYFFDARGDQQHGAPLTPLHDAMLPSARLRWPEAARIRDSTVFAPSLIGRWTASDQDTWTRYWDVGTATTGRRHPAGLLVEQRTLAFSTANLEDVVFFLFRIVNISARDAAPYQQLARYGYDAAGIAEIAALGAAFQDFVEPRFSVQVPDAGYTINAFYIQFGQDPDVGQAGSNYSNTSLVFSTGMAWKSNFRESAWSYPANIFAPPFAQAPGLVAEAFLRTPQDPGPTLPPRIAMSSNSTGGAPFPDPVGIPRLWRNMSGNLLPTDGTCSVPNPQVRHFCYFAQVAADTRYFMSTGPSVLLPGDAATFIMAQVHAPAVEAPIPVVPLPDVKGGFPLDGTRLVLGQDTVRTIDRIAGWVSSADANVNGRIEAAEVTTVPRSLFDRVKLAQAVLDAGFLAPEAPDAPDMFVVPGDNNVSVVWRPSVSELAGDPYFPVASNVASPLYDPDFRRYDVEGYRVWRGRSVTDMRLLAQFDYRGTVMQDYTGQFTDVAGSSAYGTSCAPELGVTTTCPAFPHPVDLAGTVVQVRAGDRVLLANGAVALLRSDTALTGDNSGLPPLRDTDVPFVYVDSTVRNGETWLYAVTAFDVNSIRSAPSSSESPLSVHAATPRTPSSLAALGSVGAAEQLGRSGVALPPGTVPALNPVTGIFSGPMPPADGFTMSLEPYAASLLSNGDVTLTMDSIVPGSTMTGFRPTEYYFTSVGTGAPIRFMLPVLSSGDLASNVVTVSRSEGLSWVDTAQASRFGADSLFQVTGPVAVSVPGAWGLTTKGRADANAAPPGPYNGPRWWTGAANENTADPNGLSCGQPPPVGNGFFSCVLSDLSRNSGALPGVGIFGIRAYHTVGTAAPARDLEGITSTVFRAADFRWYWGNNGAVDSVIDVTHNVAVPFSAKIRASWGILNDSSFAALTPAQVANLPDTSRARLTWTDQFCVDPVPAYLGFVCGGASQPPAVLMNHARLSPITFASSTYPNPTQSAVAATGTGFMLYLNGHFFLMQMSALPAQGTVWNARFYAGNITGTPGTYAFSSVVRPPAVPGLRLRIAIAGATFATATTTDSTMALIHTVPDPYYLWNSLETGGRQILRFVNLPGQAIIRIYSASGVLVQLLSHNDATGGGEQAWDLRSRTGQRIASGVYFFHVEAPDGRQRVGRFVVVNGER